MMPTTRRSAKSAAADSPSRSPRRAVSSTSPRNTRSTGNLKLEEFLPPDCDASGNESETTATGSGSVEKTQKTNGRKGVGRKGESSYVTEVPERAHRQGTETRRGRKLAVESPVKGRRLSPRGSKSVGEIETEHVDSQCVDINVQPAIADEKSAVGDAQPQILLFKILKGNEEHESVVSEEVKEIVKPEPLKSASTENVRPEILESKSIQGDVQPLAFKHVQNKVEEEPCKTQGTSSSSLVEGVTSNPVPDNKDTIMKLAASVIVGKLKQTLNFKLSKPAKSESVYSESSKTPSWVDEIDTNVDPKSVFVKDGRSRPVVEETEKTGSVAQIEGSCSGVPDVENPNILSDAKKVKNVDREEEKWSTKVTSVFKPKDPDVEAIAEIASSLQQTGAEQYVNLGSMEMSEFGITEEHINQIQAVLSSDEAKEILNDPTSFPTGSSGHAADSEVFDVEEATKLLQGEVVKRYAPLEHSYVKADPAETGARETETKSSDSPAETSGKKANGKKRSNEAAEDILSPRRSTRVIEAEQRAMAEKIRQENIEAERKAMRKLQEQKEGEKKKHEEPDKQEATKPKQLKVTVEVDISLKEGPKSDSTMSSVKDRAKHKTDESHSEKPLKKQKLKEQGRSKDRQQAPSPTELVKKKVKPDCKRSQSMGMMMPDEPVLFTPDIPVNKNDHGKVKEEDEAESSKMPGVFKRRDSSSGHDKDKNMQKDSRELSKKEHSGHRKEETKHKSPDKKPENPDKDKAKPIKEVSGKTEKKEFGTQSKDVESDDSDLNDGLSYEDDEGDEDWEEEDDPTKLWCICREPHGDRFMICCDKCDEWYHGDCVEITKARGVAMEKNDEEWICPVCKDKEITELKKTNVKSELKSERMKEKKEKEDQEDRKREISLQALKDKKERRESRDHSSCKERTPIKEEKSDPDDKDGGEKTTKPKLGEIRKKDHSKDSPLDPKKHKKRFKVFGHRDEPPKQHCIGTGCHNWAEHGSIYCSQKCIVRHANESIRLIQEERTRIGLQGKPEAGKVLDKVLDRIVVMERHTGRLVTGPNAPTHANLKLWLEKNPTFEVLRPGQQQGYISSSKFYRKEIKEELKKEAHAVQPKQEASSSGPSEVRLNVRKHLKDILIARSDSAYDIVLSHSEIKKIVIHIEEELFKFYGDCGSKYKARYRSLAFNIKDSKNEGLFRKILNEEIKPFTLVRMSSDELASKELAKWREMETKHELQKIEEIEKETKQNQIRKITHKGEISVTEENMADLDSPIRSTKEKTKAEPDPLTSVVADTTSMHRSHLFDLNCKICTGKVAPPKDDAPPPKRLRIAKTVSTEHDEHWESKDREVKKARVRDSKEQKDRDREKKEKRGSPGPSMEPSSTSSSPMSDMPSSSSLSRELHLHKHRKVPSIWKGFVFMPEVTKFFTTASAISGPADFVRTDLPDSIVVCGRISPSQIWSYLKEVKESGTRDIIVIGFNASTDEEKTSYVQYYRYLGTRERCGVVKPFSKHVKDMYIVPLSSHAPIHPVLLPFDGPGLEDIRPHMLMGIIVRQKMKRHPSEPSHHHHDKGAHPVKRHRHSDSIVPAHVTHHGSSSIDSDEPSFTPPNSPPKLLSDVPKDAHLIEAYDPTDVTVKKSSGDMKAATSTNLSVDPIVKEYAGADPSKLEVEPGPGASPYSPSDDEDDGDIPYDPADPSEDPVEPNNSQQPLPQPLVSGLMCEISKGKSQAETTAAMLATLATTPDLASKQQLLLELTRQVEMQKQRLAAKQMASQHIRETEPAAPKRSEQISAPIDKGDKTKTSLPTTQESKDASKVEAPVRGTTPVVTSAMKGILKSSKPADSETSVVRPEMDTETPCFVSGISHTSQSSEITVKSIYSDVTVGAPETDLELACEKESKKGVEGNSGNNDINKSDISVTGLESKCTLSPAVAKPTYQVNLPPGMLKHLSLNYDSDEEEEKPSTVESTDSQQLESVTGSSDSLKFANLPLPIMDLLSGQNKAETSEPQKEQSFASMFNKLFGTKGMGEMLAPPPLPPGISASENLEDQSLIKNVMKNVQSILGTDVTTAMMSKSLSAEPKSLASEASEQGEITGHSLPRPPKPEWMTQVDAVLKPPLPSVPPLPPGVDKDKYVHGFKPPSDTSSLHQFPSVGDVDMRQKNAPAVNDIDFRDPISDRPPPEYYNRSKWNQQHSPPPERLPGRPYRRPPPPPPGTEEFLMPHHRSPHPPGSMELPMSHHRSPHPRGTEEFPMSRHRPHQLPGFEEFPMHRHQPHQPLDGAEKDRRYRPRRDDHDTDWRQRGRSVWRTGQRDYR